VGLDLLAISSRICHLPGQQPDLIRFGGGKDWPTTFTGRGHSFSYWYGFFGEKFNTFRCSFPQYDAADAEADCNWAEELVFWGQQAGRPACSDFVQPCANLQAIGSGALGLFEGSLWSIAIAGVKTVCGGT
jgi:hypothetical protein